MPASTLASLGWDQTFASGLPLGASPGRVVRVDRGVATVETATATLRATTRAPVAVGDWVAVAADPPTVTEVLPRRSAIVRQAAGTVTAEQVLAANVDTVFLVVPLSTGPNLRRLERSLALAWSSGAVPVVVLTKADRCADVEAAVDEVETVALGVDVVVTSALTGDGIDELRRWTTPGPDGVAPTVALIGASGAGKSTLVNALTGEQRMDTGGVRASDDRGRHTTTHRELVALPDGGLLLDTPGLRAVGLWTDADGIDAAFADIEQLATACRFRDCAHDGEPGCAVSAAIADGSLAPERLASWHKLQRELAHLAARHDQRLAAEQKRVWLQRAKAYRALTKERGDRD
jgi:ribosome biogenesis GTPase / thiamine phosphate phosphatase